MRESKRKIPWFWLAVIFMIPELIALILGLRFIFYVLKGA